MAEIEIDGQVFTVTPGKYRPGAQWLSSPSGSRLDWMDIAGMSRRQIRAALRNRRNFQCAYWECEWGSKLTSWRSYQRHRSVKHNA